MHSSVQSKSDLDTEWFRLTNMTVLTSKEDISMNQWKNYLLEHKAKFVRSHARILVLTGVHGKPDGSIGPPCEGLLEDSTGQLGVLGRKFMTERLEKDRIVFAFDEDDQVRENVTVKILDVGAHLRKGATEDGYTLDEAKLLRDIWEFQPTVLVLAFCQTDKSCLNAVFQAAGVYSILIMKKERSDITQERCLFLDEQQKQVIDRVVEEKPKNVFLYGDYGTGKTLLLLEIARIKSALHKRKGKNVKVVFLTYSYGCDLLIEDLKSTYDFPDIDITFESNLKELCQKLDVPFDGFTFASSKTYAETRKTLSKLTQALGEKGGTNSHSVLVVDEVTYGRDKSDWSAFDAGCNNADVVFSMYLPIGSDIRVPKSKDTLSLKLNNIYRNCRQVQMLRRFYDSHPLYKDLVDDYEASRSRATKKLSLVSGLPVGRTPVWVQYEGDLGDDCSWCGLLDLIRDRLVDPEAVVTVMSPMSPEHIPSENMEWLDKNGWGYCRRGMYSSSKTMRGKYGLICPIRDMPKFSRSVNKP